MGVLDVMSCWLGEVEGVICVVFEYVCECKFCVFFFDELDVLVYLCLKGILLYNWILVNEFLV